MVVAQSVVSRTILTTRAVRNHNRLAHLAVLDHTPALQTLSEEDVREQISRTRIAEHIDLVFVLANCAASDFVTAGQAFVAGFNKVV